MIYLHEAGTVMVLFTGVCIYGGRKEFFFSIALQEDQQPFNCSVRENCNILFLLS
jgi:hypothetical protein